MTTRTLLAAALLAVAQYPAQAYTWPVEFKWEGAVSTGTFAYTATDPVYWYHPHIPLNEMQFQTDSWDREDRGQNDTWQGGWWEEPDGETVRFRLSGWTQEEVYLVMPADCRYMPPRDEAVQCALDGVIEVYRPIRDTGVVSVINQPGPTPDPHERNWSADVNNDRSIDAADAEILFASWYVVPSLWDFTGDDIFDAADAAVMFANWTGDPAPIRSVPEPALPVAALLLFVSRRFRSRRSGR